jgi:hypothetical protein
VDLYTLSQIHQTERRARQGEPPRRRRERTPRRWLLWRRRPAVQPVPGFTADPIGMPAVPAMPTRPVAIRTTSGELALRPRPSGSAA